MFSDITNLKSKRFPRFQLFSSSSAGSTKSLPTVCLTTGSSNVEMVEPPPFTAAPIVELNVVPFPSDDTDELEVELMRRNRTVVSRKSSQRRRPTSLRTLSPHNLLSPAASTCASSRPRSSSFSYVKRLGLRETSELRFLAMIRRSILCDSGQSEAMDTSGDGIRRQDALLVERLEKYLLERGYRDLFLHGEPFRSSILLSPTRTTGLALHNNAVDGHISIDNFDDSTGLVPVTPSRSHLVAALIMKHKSRSGLRTRPRTYVDSGMRRAGSPLATSPCL
ncbi:hypothetical protein C8J56DRAFT_972012 [Mycena floridula]|nr:hypothetical protein C8J56DRAFT_972012 [Mycena floridula]